MQDAETTPPPRPRGAIRRAALVGLAAGLVGGGVVVGVDRLADGGSDDSASAPVATATTTTPDTSTTGTTTTGTTPAGTDDGASGATTSRDWSAVAASTTKGVVAITAVGTSSAQGPPGTSQRSASLGSGFVLNRSGDIVTDQHVVADASAITVDFADGTHTTAKLVGADASTDIAVIRVDVAASKLHPLTLRSTGARVGEPVLAIGNPFGYRLSVSQGIVSGLGREITSPNGFTLTDAIQTDAAVNHGNSGGPLVDTRGRVIGINAQIAASGVDANVGVAFAVPIDSGTVRIIDELRTTGAVSHSWMGIAGQSVDAAAVTAGSLHVDHGVLVEGIAAGSPAAAAGLRGGTQTVTGEAAQYCVGGDIITAINGTSLDGMSDLQNALDRTKPGDTLTLSVVRSNGDTASLKMTVRAQPAQAPSVESGC